MWTLARVAHGDDRLAPWSLFDAEVGDLLDEFAPRSRRTPQYPFAHLRSSGLWEVRGIELAPA